MEKYQGRELLSSLSNERVYLVNSNDMYQDACVLKLIECIDHSHATDLLNEFNKFNNIRHHTLLTYRDIFLFWDQSESGLYIAVVSDFKRGGSLKEYVAKLGGGAVSEEKISRWIAQLVDALLTVHSQDGQSHNNVKSTNIYLDDSECIMIGDALPPNALLYRKNRKMPSEHNSNQHNSIGEHADIHGIGKLGLELTAAGLENGHTYSADLLELIRSFSDTNQSLVKVVESNRYLKCALQSIGSRHAPPTPLQNWPHARIRVPIELGVPGILSYMDSHRNYADCLQAAIGELSRIFSQTPHALASIDAQLLLNILDSAAASAEVQATTFHFLTRLRFNIEPSIFVRLLSDSLFHYTTRILSACAESPEVIIAVSDFISALAEDSRVAHRLVSNGLVPVLVESLRHQLSKNEGPDSSAALSAVCQALFRLANADNLANVALHANALPLLGECLKMPSIKLKRNALAAMISLAMEAESPKIFVATKVFEVIALTLCQHYAEAEITQLTCSVLSSLIAASKHCALALLLLPTTEFPDEEAGILGIVLNAYRAHADHGSVVEACAQLLASFSHHPEVVDEFLACQNAAETVDEIARRYRDRLSIVEACKCMQTAIAIHKKSIVV